MTLVLAQTRSGGRALDMPNRDLTSGSASPGSSSGSAPWWERWRTWQEVARPATEDPEHVPTWRPPELRRVEALLFLAREPLTSRRIAQLANLEDGTRARALVRELNRLYDLAGSAFRVEEVGGGMQLYTRLCHAPWLRRLCGLQGAARLSTSALETLTVVAYKQPASRAEIEAIRGCQCGEMLRQLMDRDLVRITGRSEALGRPFLYGTTRRFLQMFGLKRLEDLPRLASLHDS